MSIMKTGIKGWDGKYGYNRPLKFWTVMKGKTKLPPMEYRHTKCERIIFPTKSTY